MVYKTRKFVQTDKISFESWNVNTTVSAFEGSSGASWEDHSFYVSASITTYPENEASEFMVNIRGISISYNECATNENLTKIDVKHGNHGIEEVYVYSIEQLIIQSEIKNICLVLNADFTSKQNNEATSKKFAIDLRRYQRAFPGPLLD